MGVTAIWAETITIRETIGTNTGSLSAEEIAKEIVHEAYNESGRLDSTTTPAATKHASFLLTLSTGTATINLAALTGMNGLVVDFTGLKVQLIRIKNLGANTMTFAEGASNGYAIGTAIPVETGAVLMKYGANAMPAVASGDRTIDVTGTGSQTAEITLVAG